jgi:hypothetical protein
LFLIATFLYNNYNQARDILKSSPSAIATAMQDLGVSDVSVFEDWLAEEKAYLLGLQKEPLEETLQMEYWQKLLNLQASKYVTPY